MHSFKTTFSNVFKFKQLKNLFKTQKKNTSLLTTTLVLPALKTCEDTVSKKTLTHSQTHSQYIVYHWKHTL